MINVVATIRVVDGSINEFVREFNLLVPEVLKENGCIEYYPTVDVSPALDIQLVAPNCVTVIEKWESTDALQAHLVAPHMESFREKVAEMVESVEIKVLSRAE